MSTKVMRLPGWLARILSWIFPSTEYYAIFECQRCKREIVVTPEMSEIEMAEALAAHDGFFHPGA